MYSTAWTVAVKSSRLPFLVLTPACVLLGLTLSLDVAAKINGWHFGLVLLGALAAHVSVNCFNEYQDFRSGLDALTQRTPFSGGSGALQETPEAERAVLLLACLSFAMVVAIGLYFLLALGWQILPLGILGCLVVLLYTPWVNRNPWLCLVAPGLGFGVLMVCGTEFVLVGEYQTTTLLLSLVPFFLVNNLLLLNQLPDIDADRQVGRDHFPIHYGIDVSIRLYGMQWLAAVLVLLVAVVWGLIPVSSLVALIPLALGALVFRGMQQAPQTTASWVPYLGKNVVVAIVTPLLLALGIWVGL